MTPLDTPPQDAPAEEQWADELAEQDHPTEPAEAPSGLVTFTYNDAADNPVVRTGIVVRTTDEHDPDGPHGAVVAWLSDFSDPIPFDQLTQVR